MWGRMIGLNTGIAISALGGIGFFFYFANKVINEESNGKKYSLFEKGVGLVLFFVPFYIISLVLTPYYHNWNHTYLELYKYHGYPCENKVFTLKEKRPLFTHHDGSLPQSAYFITHHELEEYDDRPENDYYGSTNIPKGSQFKVIGFYLPVAKGSGLMQYFLVESLNSNKTKAWIDEYSFNSKKCYPEEVPYYDDDIQFSAERGTYGEEKIDLTDLKLLP